MLGYIVASGPELFLVLLHNDLKHLHGMCTAFDGDLLVTGSSNRETGINKCYFLPSFDGKNQCHPEISDHSYHRSTSWCTPCHMLLSLLGMSSLPHLNYPLTQQQHMESD